MIISILQLVIIKRGTHNSQLYSQYLFTRSKAVHETNWFLMPNINECLKLLIKSIGIRQKNKNTILGKDKNYNIDPPYDRYS